MRELDARFRSVYGSNLWHLLLLIGAFAVTAWIVLRLSGEATAGRMLLWFVGAAITHDFVLFPLYALADQALRRAVGTRRDAPRSRASVLNHVRFPALASGLLFLVYLPGILRQGRDTYLAATGLHRQSYLTRWLLVSAALFLLSGAWYVLRRARPRQGSRQDSSG
ncbi:hypothetical protein DLE60_15695 [Micromonospora globispora]|uniref:Uncharacterized protein n=1 Tax=Micromonospora globispora TaxID=1450148 RepID=A0A317KKP9_9ACTN|nr:hypothetical protein [Micromonospora globispora]PWU54004.1 hypothetical protein DLJ46_00360 [Micromonospora globispora]PWU59518.1 hypothetical protein DLE60_15695 [Micromonospora globispora]